MDYEAKHHHLLRPHQPPTTTDSASAATNTTLEARKDFKNFTLRLVLIASVALFTVWANQEASKGFAVTIVNDAGDTSAGKRFHLFYVSNDVATRLLLERSNFVENILYPSVGLNGIDSNQNTKKKINHVVLRLSSRNLTSPVTTESGEHDKFVINLSPSIMDEPNFKHATFLAVQRGVARIWLWDGEGNAPTSLINGIVEYITSLSVSGGTPRSSDGNELPEYSRSGGCWEGNNDPRAVAKFLNYCEGKREGFVRRLNQEMKNGWQDGMMDDALGVGMPARILCHAYCSSSGDLSISSI